MVITNNWKAKIRLSNGLIQEVGLQADNYSNATAMLEAQYGKGKIFNLMRDYPKR
jgi:hypothetical protein